MKKIIALLLAAMMALSAAACSDSSTDSSTDASKNSSSENNTNSSSQSEESESVSIADGVELLTTVWDSYDEADKFPVMGGDTTEGNMNTEGPGQYGLEDTAALDSTLGFPAAAIDQIDSAASLMHMMNANTFTCGAYHVTDEADMDKLADTIKENILNRQWMCGFPDQLIIVKVDRYLVAFFGEKGITDTFKTKLMAAYPSAQIVSETPIA